MYIETNHWITTAAFLTSYMTFYAKRWVQPGFVTSQTSALGGNVRYTAEMTTLHDRNTV